MLKFVFSSNFAKLRGKVSGTQKTTQNNNKRKKKNELKAKNETKNTSLVGYLKKEKKGWERKSGAEREGERFVALLVYDRKDKRKTKKERKEVLHARHEEGRLVLILPVPKA